MNAVQVLSFWIKYQLSNVIMLNRISVKRTVHQYNHPSSSKEKDRNPELIFGSDRSRFQLRYQDLQAQRAAVG